MPLLKTLQLLPKAFRIKSDLFILLYKAPYHPAPPFLGHKDPLVVAQSYALPLLPRSGQALLLSCKVLSSSCMAGLLLSLRSQIKCCFFIEPFSTTPQRMVHLAFLACPLQSTWLFLQSFDEFVPLMVCHHLPHQCGKSMKIGVMCILFYRLQCLAQRGAPYTFVKWM